MGEHFIEITKDVELLVSHPLNMLNVDVMPSTLDLGIDSQVLHSPSLKVNFFHFQLEWSFLGNTFQNNSNFKGVLIQH